MPKERKRYKQKELRIKIHQHNQVYLKENEIGLLGMKNIVIGIKNPRFNSRLHRTEVKFSKYEISPWKWEQNTERIHGRNFQSRKMYITNIRITMYTSRTNTKTHLYGLKMKLHNRWRNLKSNRKKGGPIGKALNSSWPELRWKKFL